MEDHAHFLTDTLAVLIHTKHAQAVMNTNNSKISVFKQIYNVYYTKTAKMLDTHNCLQYHIKKMLRHPNFFHSEPSVLSKDAPAKFHLSATFGLSFMVSSVASTCSPNFYIFNYQNQDP